MFSAKNEHLDVNRSRIIVELLSLGEYIYIYIPESDY